MPKVGETINGRALGRRDSSRYIWMSCVECGEFRWVRLNKGKPMYKWCRSCADKLSGFRRCGSGHASWKGGRLINNQGYVLIKSVPQDTFYCMANVSRYILEHRLVMAQHLGRPLLGAEWVHHKNGIKDDNRIENLELISPNSHMLRTALCSQCPLKEENHQLRVKIRNIEKMWKNALGL